MGKKKQRLGRGLSALINNADTSYESSGSDLNTDLISLNKIVLGRYQARKKFNEESLQQLAKSIELNGLIQPIIVRKSKIKKKFEVIAGERRLRASKIAKIDKIPAIISTADDKKAFESGLIENLQREDLNLIEEAEGYSRLIEEFNYTQEELSIVVSKSRSHVANLLRIISLPIEVKKYIINGQLSLGHAKCLVGYDNASHLASRIIKEGLTVRYIEKLFGEEKIKNQDTSFFDSNIVKEKDADTTLLEKELSLKLGLKITINDKQNKGNIKIQYKNIEQREKIIKKLRGA